MARHLAVALLLLGAVPAQAPGPAWDTLNARTPPAWFEDAKFGIFIHWGVYSVPAFCDTSTYSEWYQHWLDTNSHGGLVRRFHERVYGKDFAYHQFAEQFRAELWDPAEWAAIFRRAGARYVVITSKHHDGFCLWPSDIAGEVRGHPWDAVRTGPKRDLLGELAAAVRQEGLAFGLYYSFLEWHNPLFQRSIPDYVERQMLPQIRDLIARYQPDVFWPDGEWEQPDTTWRSPEILAWLYQNAPNRERLVVNDRWGKGLRGRTGDFYTTEYGSGGGGGDSWSGRRIFEECRGIGHSFAFNRAEGYDVYLSRTECVRTLIDLVSRGGNLLLDIGPDADGTIPLIMVDRLLAIGRWLEVNGESIYGTAASPFAVTPWGRATRKGDTVYLHVFDWPADNRLPVPGLGGTVRSARVLSDARQRELPRFRDADGVLQLGLWEHHPDEHATVIAVDLAGPLQVDRRFLPGAGGVLTLPATAATLTGPELRLEAQPDRRSGTPQWNLGYWTSREAAATWSDVVLRQGVDYAVELEVAVAPGEGGVLRLDLGEMDLSCRLEPTGGWRDYRTVAPFTFTNHRGGALTVRATVSELGRSALCNLRRITFRPVDAAGAAPATVPLADLERTWAELAAMERDLQAGRHQAVAARYADDAVLLGPGGSPVTGRAAIDAYWARLGGVKSWDLEVWQNRGGGGLIHQLGRSTLVRERDGQEHTSVVDFALTWRLGADGSLRIVSDIYWDPPRPRAH